MSLRVLTTALTDGAPRLRALGLAAVLLGGLVSAVPAQAAPAAGARQQGRDEVTFTDGKTQVGEVVEENYEQLMLQVKKGASQGFDWSKIASVKYASPPKEYVEALDARARAPEEALTQLKAVLADPELRPVFKQNVMQAIAALEQQLGNMQAAAADWDALIKAFPMSRYLGTAARGLVDAQLALGDPAAAGKVIDALGKDAGSKLPTSFQALLTVLRGRVLRAQQKYADARQAYESASKMADLPPDVAGSAKLGIAECLKAEGKGADAEARFREIVSTPGPTFILAGAWNGLADVLLEQGHNKRDADLLLQALYGYLRGVVQYVPAEGEPKDEYERSIAGAADAFSQISQLEQDKTRKALFERRANDELELLRRLFPQSKYLPK